MTAIADMTWDDVLDIAPELVGIPELKQGFILALVRDTVEESLYFTQTVAFSAGVFLAAHYAVSFPNTTDASDYDASISEPELQSVKIGDVTKTFANGASSSGSGNEWDSEFGSTFYGKQYLRLTRGSVIAAMVV